MSTGRPAPPLPGLRWRGFTLQFFLITILPLTVLLLAIAVGSQSLHHASMRALVGDRDLRAVRAAATGLTHEIEHRQAVLAALSAAAPTLQTQAAAQAFLAQPNLPLHGFDHGLAIYSPTGQILAQTNPMASSPHDNAPPGRAVLEPPLQAIAIQSPATFIHSPVRVMLEPPAAPNTQSPPLSPPPPGVQPGQVWFDPPLPLDAGGWQITLNALTPGGSRLVAGFDPSTMADGLLHSISGPGSSTVLVLSAQGDLLYQAGVFSHHLLPSDHPGAAEALRGEWGVNYTQSDGEQSGGSHGEHVVAFAPVPPLGWGLVIEESWEDIASPLLNTTQSAPLLLAPLLVLAIVALWFGARQIIQPLQALEQRAARLARGDFQSIRAPVGGITEIQHLQTELVEMAQAVQAAQDSLHGYIGALTAGVENERSTLARELHDDTLQALIALNQRVQLASLQTGDPVQRKSLADLQASVTATITNLRRAIGGLRPIYLEDLGLVAALGMLCREVKQAASFPVDFTLTGVETRLSPAAELAFYRIAQEALSNAAHHAQPTRASLTLAFHSGGVTLTLQDDGRGFTVPNDPNAFARQGHYGLLGMRERAELIGGKFAIESGADQGTRITVELGVSALSAPE